MTKNNVVRSVSLLVALSTIILFFQNCSSGGGSSGGSGGSASAVSGVAVAGAPIVGTVTIKDSSVPPKTKFVVIEADGGYTIDVTGLTAPFMLRADGSVGGRSYSIYSAATLADINGNINVTPLTDLIVANIAGQLASTYFTSGNFTNLTTSELNTQTSALQARLLPILAAAGVSGSIDLLRSSFNADHTGLDAALDILRVDVDPNTAMATITCIINNQVITDNLASKSDATVIVDTGVAAGLTDVQTVLGKFVTFTGLFATSLPASNNATLLALLDSTFLFDGQDRATFISDLTSNPTMIGIQFTNVSLVEGTLLPANGSPTQAQVSFKVIQGGNPQEDMIFNLIKTGSVWTLTGNGHIGQARASAFARLQDTPAPNSIDSGLLFEIKNSGAYPFDYAIISGPGLPSYTINSTLSTAPTDPNGGALYFADLSSGSFAAAQLGTPYNGSSTTRISSFGFNQIPLNDVQIGLIPDNSTYRIEFYEDNGTTATGNDQLVAVYTSKLGKRPYLSNELTLASFAPITAPTKAQIWSVATAGGAQTFNWTIPSGLFSRELHYFRNGNGSGTNSSTESFDLVSTSSTKTITLTAVSTAPGNFGALQAVGVNLYMRDAFGRELCTIYNGAP